MDSIWENCDILRLPSELLLSLVELLPGKDVVNFSLTCTRFSFVCRNFRRQRRFFFRPKVHFLTLVIVFRSLRFENCWQTGISIGDFKAHLSISVDPTQLTECNFNSCYWLPAVLLQNFIKKCENLEVLKISETKLNCGHLAHIFGKCKRITHLSITLSHNDLKLTQRGDRNGVESCSDMVLQQTCLKDCHTSMQKLVKLELVLFHSSIRELTILLRYLLKNNETYYIMPVFIFSISEHSFCHNLKQLVLIPVKDQDSNIHMNIQFSEVKGKFLLDSLVVINMEEDTSRLSQIARQSLKRRYQEYLVFKTDMTQLRNHWNDSSPCPVIKDKFSSLAFKRFRIPRGMFEVWWIEKNLPSHAEHPVNHELEADGWYLNDPLENVDLSDVKSIREPFPVFINKGLKAPHAKLICCFYFDQVNTYEKPMSIAVVLLIFFYYLGIFRFLSESSSC